jgi:hypothetical protein
MFDSDGIIISPISERIKDRKGYTFDTQVMDIYNWGLPIASQYYYGEKDSVQF